MRIELTDQDQVRIELTDQEPGEDRADRPEDLGRTERCLFTRDLVRMGQVLEDACQAMTRDQARSRYTYCTIMSAHLVR